MINCTTSKIYYSKTNKSDKMKEQHIKLININNFVPKEGQRDLMCCNKKSFVVPLWVLIKIALKRIKILLTKLIYKIYEK